MHLNLCFISTRTQENNFAFLKYIEKPVYLYKVDVLLTCISDYLKDGIFQCTGTVDDQCHKFLKHKKFLEQHHVIKSYNYTCENLKPKYVRIVIQDLLV